jgi:hypothetical protein
MPVRQLMNDQATWMVSPFSPAVANVAAVPVVRVAPESPGSDACIVQILTGEVQLSLIADPHSCSRVVVLDRVDAPRQGRLVCSAALASGDLRPVHGIELATRSLCACLPHRQSWVQQQYSRS